MSTEREIDLRELLYYALKKWRVIIIFGLIIALIIGALKILSATNGDELDDNSEIRSELTQQLNDLKRNIDSQIDYNENSILMKIDPLNKYRASFEICINAADEQDSSAANPNEDISNRLVAAYSAYLTSDSFYSYILDNTDFIEASENEYRYLREVLWCVVDYDASAVTVNISGVNEETVQEILECVKYAVSNERSEIAATMGEHNYDVILETVYSVVDHDLENTQDKNRQIVEDYRTKVEKKETELAELGIDVTQNGYSKKQVVIGAVASFIVTIVLVVAYYVFEGIITRKMWSNSHWQSFKIPVLGEVYTEKNKRAGEKIDSWIARIMGCAKANASIEESGALSAANVIAALKENNASSAAIIGRNDSDLCSKIMASMNKANPDSLSFAGDILTDPNAVMKLSDNKEAVLLAEAEKITVDEVGRIKTLLDVWGKNLLGVILVK